MLTYISEVYGSSILDENLLSLKWKLEGISKLSDGFEIELNLNPFTYND